MGRAVLVFLALIGLALRNLLFPASGFLASMSV